MNTHVQRERPARHLKFEQRIGQRVARRADRRGRAGGHGGSDVSATEARAQRHVVTGLEALGNPHRGEILRRVDEATADFPLDVAARDFRLAVAVAGGQGHIVAEDECAFEFEAFRFDLTSLHDVGHVLRIVRLAIGSVIL
jgi:hypothetical protein